MDEIEEMMNAQFINEAVDNSEPTPINVKDNLVGVRFSSAPWVEEINKAEITVVGVGGIGSWTTVLLARCNANIVVYDNDVVDSTNLSGQLYSIDQLNLKKTEALNDLCTRFSGNQISYISERFKQDSTVSDITICGLDNMYSRELVFDSWINRIKDYSKERQQRCLFVDGRLAAEELQVFTIEGDNDYAIKQYKKKWLFADFAAEKTDCSYKQTSYCANMIASIINNMVVNHCFNISSNCVIKRILPFYTNYDATLMIMNQE